MFGLSILAGCSVGPDYLSPATPLSGHFAESSESSSARSDLTRWWTGFRDPILSQLEDEATIGNLDTAAAGARIRQARAMRAVAVGGLFPVVAGSASAEQSLTPGTGPDRVNWLFRAGFDASWELDLFGGQRRTVEAAGYGVEAAGADLQAVMLTLAGDVALNYIDLRGTQARLGLARRTAVSQRETASLTRTKFVAGTSSSLDLANATALAASTEAQIPLLEINRALFVHRLGVLLGREPGALIILLARTGPIPSFHQRIQSGIPADLLSRRPDIARAERQLAQATANVGVADAARYPSVSLNGSLASSASRLGDLGKGSTIGWSWGPTLTVPIFEGGRLAAAVDVAGAERDQSWLAFRSAVLIAMEDVENALVARTQDRIRSARLAESAAAYSRAARLSRDLWQAGTSSFLEVLDAERSRYSAEDALIQSRVAISADAIALAKALGGGWEAPLTVDRPLIVDINTGPHLAFVQ